MDAASLTADQRSAVAIELAWRRDWLRKLVARMDARGWRRDCPAYVATVAAHDAVHRALVAVIDAAPTEPEPGPPKTWSTPTESAVGTPPAPLPWVGRRGKRRRR